MRLAFCLFKYFPFGGLQRDFRRIADACVAKGHQIDVFAMAWQGDVPGNLRLHLLPCKALSNHGRCKEFADKVAKAVAAEAYDAVVGFNKIPGLDVYFAADPCFEAKVREKHGWLYRLGGRYRTYAALERGVFAPEAGTDILLISEVEKPHFIRHYQTPEARFHFLPPGIDRAYLAPADADRIRAEVRRELGVPEGDNAILMVGSGFKTKGLDRSLRALSALPDLLKSKTRLFVVGQGKARPFLALAGKLGVRDRLTMLGGRNDVPRLMLGADILLHPSYYENTGTVLVEAIASGLPVLATDICGYGHYVQESGAGKLVPSPFQQETLNALLKQMLTSEERSAWKVRGLDYAAKVDLFSLPQKAAEIIEQAGQRNA